MLAGARLAWLRPPAAAADPADQHSQHLRGRATASPSQGDSTWCTHMPFMGRVLHPLRPAAKEVRAGARSASTLHVPVTTAVCSSWKGRVSCWAAGARDTPTPLRPPLPRHPRLPPSSTTHVVRPPPQDVQLQAASASASSPRVSPRASPREQHCQGVHPGAGRRGQGLTPGGPHRQCWDAGRWAGRRGPPFACAAPPHTVGPTHRRTGPPDTARCVQERHAGSCRLVEACALVSWSGSGVVAPHIRVLCVVWVMQGHDAASSAGVTCQTATWLRQWRVRVCTLMSGQVPRSMQPP